MLKMLRAIAPLSAIGASVIGCASLLVVQGAIAPRTLAQTEETAPPPATQTEAIPAALDSALPIERSEGVTTVSGDVSTGQQIYRLEATAGERLVIQVEVTEMLPGAIYTDDDSQLFVFNQFGRLIAENDDDGLSYQSVIDYVVIPADGTYFIAVTTWPNRPLLDDNRTLTGWQDNGQSHIRFNLLITETEPRQ